MGLAALTAPLGRATSVTTSTDGRRVTIVVGGRTIEAREGEPELIVDGGARPIPGAPCRGPDGLVVPVAAAEALDLPRREVDGGVLLGAPPRTARVEPGGESRVVPGEIDRFLLVRQRLDDAGGPPQTLAVGIDRAGGFATRPPRVLDDDTLGDGAFEELRAAAAGDGFVDDNLVLASPAGIAEIAAAPLAADALAANWEWDIDKDPVDGDVFYFAWDHYAVFVFIKAKVDVDMVDLAKAIVAALDGGKVGDSTIQVDGRITVVVACYRTAERRKGDVALRAEVKVEGKAKVNLVKSVVDLVNEVMAD